MRKIKFRAWDGKRMTTSGIMFNCSTGFLETPIGAQMKLMQYTGLTDKNGVEIFEGDVLKVGENLICEIMYVDNNVDDYGDEINCAFHAKVYRHDKIIPLDGYLKKDCKVIGNIYENPELL
jgi:uncharacterized phage protein (TIGR01671 family)